MDVTIDFDTLPDGTPLRGGDYVQAEYDRAHGVWLSASGGFLNIPIPLLLDTSDTGSSDFDVSLGSPNEQCSPSGPGVGSAGEPDAPGENCEPQGNVLVNQRQSGDNDDVTSTIRFDFASKVQSVHQIGLMNIGLNGASIRISYMDESGEQTETMTVAGLGKNSVQTVPINTEKVSRLFVDMTGLGAVTFVDICVGSDAPTPAPSPLPPFSAMPFAMVVPPPGAFQVLIDTAAAASTRDPAGEDLARTSVSPAPSSAPSRGP